MFSVLSASWLFKSERLNINIKPRVEANSNTSTAALRVVGGDEKGTQYLGYLLLGGYK
jgi:hypothetical protein